VDCGDVVIVPLRATGRLKSAGLHEDMMGHELERDDAVDQHGGRIALLSVHLQPLVPAEQGMRHCNLIVSI
jgi:hypothetical protein